MVCCLQILLPREAESETAASGKEAAVQFWNNYFCFLREIHIVLRELTAASRAAEKLSAIKSQSHFRLAVIIRFFSSALVKRSCSSTLHHFSIKHVTAANNPAEHVR
jgi:hypothetical protein